MEMELGNESLKHQGNRTRTYSGNNEFIPEMIRTVSQTQIHRNWKNYHTLEMLWVFSKGFVVWFFYLFSHLATTGIPGLFSFTETARPSPSHCRAAPSSLVTVTMQHSITCKLSLQH